MYANDFSKWRIRMDGDYYIFCLLQDSDSFTSTDSPIDREAERQCTGKLEASFTLHNIEMRRRKPDKGKENIQRSFLGGKK